MGYYTHPPGSLRRRGRRLPAGRPELVYSAPRFKRARRSTASERNREEPGVLTRLHAQQDRPLAARARIRKSFADFLRACDALARDIKDHVPGAEALRGGRTVRIDLCDHDAFVARAGNLAGRSEREAEARHVGAAVVAALRGRAGLTLLAR